MGYNYHADYEPPGGENLNSTSSGNVVAYKIQIYPENIKYHWISYVYPTIWFTLVFIHSAYIMQTEMNEIGWILFMEIRDYI